MVGLRRMDSFISIEKDIDVGMADRHGVRKFRSCIFQAQLFRTPNARWRKRKAHSMLQRKHGTISGVDGQTAK